MVLHLLLLIPAVQKKIVSIALNELTDITHSKMSVGDFYLRPFNHLDIEELYIEDLKGDTLLYAGKLSAGFNLLKLLNNQLLISSVVLNDFDIKIKKDSLNGDFNFQFLIDAFASKDKTKKDTTGSMIIEIDDIRLSKGQLSYDIQDQTSVDTVFDANHILLTDFSTRISLKSIDLEKLDIRLKKLILKEKSGFELKNLQLAIRSDKKKISLKNFLLELPASKIKLPSASVDYTGYELSQLITDGTFLFEVKSDICPADLQAFFLPLKDLKESFILNGNISGKLPAVEVDQLEVSYGNFLHLNTKAFLNDYIHWDKSAVRLSIKSLFIDSESMSGIFKAFTGNPEVPQILRNLGKAELSGYFSGTLPFMDLKANLSSKPGSFDLYGTAGYHFESKNSRFDISLQTEQFNLNTLMQDTILGDVSLKLTAAGDINSANIDIRSHLDINHLTFNKYVYRHILADASYSKDSIFLKTSFNDVNADFFLDGMYFTGKNKQVAHGRVYAKVDELQLEKLNLVKDFQHADLSAIIHGDITGNTLDELAGFLSLDSLSFKNDRGEFKEDQIRLTLTNNPDKSKDIHLDSDILKGSVSGKYSLETISTSLNNMFHQYLPSLIPEIKVKKKAGTDMNLAFFVGNTEKISEVFGLSFAVIKPGTINGTYKDTLNILNLQARFPQINVGKMLLYETDLDINSHPESGQINTSLQTLQIDTDTTNLKLDIFARNDSVDTKLSFVNATMPLNGSLALGIKFIENMLHKATFPDTYINFYPTKTHFKNQDFEVKPSLITIIGDTYTVHDFEIIHPSIGNISIDGIVSPNESDTLKLEFEHLQLSPLSEMLKYQGVPFRAEVNGSVIMNRLLTAPRIITDNFTFKDIYIENNLIGDLDVKSGWSERRQAALIGIKFRQSNGHTSDISGVVLPSKDSLAIKMNIDAIPLNWAQPFVRDFLFGMRGELALNLSAGGKLSNPTIDGSLYIKDGGFGVKMTNVRYKISDSIRIKPNMLDFQRFVIADPNGNTSTISGNITHKNFKTFNSDVRMELKNFLMLSNPIQTDSLFYGTLKLNGSLAVTGNEKGLDVKASIKKGTSGKVYVQLPESESGASRYSNITYINNEDEKLKQEQEKVAQEFTKMLSSATIPIKLNLGAEITPDLTLGVIINPVTKDAATVNGNGNITFDYNLPSGSMKLLGSYTVEEGKCVLSLKNITSKTFTIQKGSTVTFKGDPLSTAFNISAIYTLRADLTSLDDSFANDMYLPTTRVRTDCILNISGDINKMNISYSVKIPEVDESVQRKVSSLMYSDDIRIKEVAYLLALGSFYPPEGNQGTSVKTSIWTSLASSTLSTQLNNLLSGVLKENWTVGTSFRSNDDSFSDMEMDVNVSTRLFNNRLTVNTNLGYKNNTTRPTNFTGDFQAEYKLTRTGELSLKAYNVTNDEYYRQALTTQGVGIVYRKESKTFKELFKKTIRRITGNRPQRNNKTETLNNETEVKGSNEQTNDNNGNEENK